MQSTSLPTNRFAVASLMTAILTLVSFCLGVIPIPLSAWVCYPAAAFSGVFSLIFGFIALRQLRSNAGKGRLLAWLGLSIGVLTLLAVLCFTTLSILVFYYGVQGINSIWPQLRP